MARRRLDHVDAMRPVKQAGVISTHAILYFAPAAASAGSGAALLLLHVSREGFFFISACMLTYAYTDLNRARLRRFYWRRFLSVGIPTCAGVSSTSSALFRYRTTRARWWRSEDSPPSWRPGTTSCTSCS
jgi:hypothetical protein